MNVGRAMLPILALACMTVAQERMPPIPADKLTPAQQDAARQLAATPRGNRISGPFVALLRSPEFMNRLQKTGEYLRYQSSLSGKIREFTILMTARQWDQQYEWNAHYPLAIREGLGKEKAVAIATGKRPEGMLDDEDSAYDFVNELLKTKHVSDATYARAIGKFGEQGVIDITGLTGYYSAIGMILNVARTPVSATSDAPKLLPLSK